MSKMHGHMNIRFFKQPFARSPMLSDHASQVQVSLLLQEGMTMYGLSHKNVLSVLGVSIEDHTAPFLIYPYRGDTNLKR
jgi:RYK receptor-like tyrosine kinase